MMSNGNRNSGNKSNGNKKTNLTNKTGNNGNSRNNANNSRCPISGKCGGCQYIDMSYEAQLEKKRKAVSGLLREFGGVESIIGMEEPYHYRNKVNAAFRHKRNGEIVSGIYEEGSHRVLSVPDCLIENRQAQDIIESVRKLLKSFKITVHNEDTGYGLLRHVMVRTGHATGQVMVVLVTASPILPSKRNFTKALLNEHPEITTIVQNINEKKTSMVLGERNQTLYGKGYIEDVLCGKRFRISPTSFYQVNPVQTEILYNKAMEYAGLTGNETVIDAYCGTGTIGIVASDKAKKVIGVELNKEAIRDANFNSKMNNVKNISFYNNDAGRFMLEMEADAAGQVEVVFMDPPRSGSSEAFLSALLTIKPKRVVYISCGPESLARDLRYMTKGGVYRIEKISAIDLFPWTEHCEVVCLLSCKTLV